MCLIGCKNNVNRRPFVGPNSRPTVLSWSQEDQNTLWTQSVGTHSFVFRLPVSSRESSIDVGCCYAPVALFVWYHLFVRFVFPTLIVHDDFQLFFFQLWEIQELPQCLHFLHVSVPGSQCEDLVQAVDIKLATSESAAKQSCARMTSYSDWYFDHHLIYICLLPDGFVGWHPHSLFDTLPKDDTSR